MSVKTKTYQCISPMIQLVGPDAFSNSSGRLTSTLETIFRKGDILPTWTRDEDIARLLADGFIEEVSG